MKLGSGTIAGAFLELCRLGPDDDGQINRTMLRAA